MKGKRRYGEEDGSFRTENNSRPAVCPAIRPGRAGQRQSQRVAGIQSGPQRVSDVARLSPLLHEHINLPGRYDFTLPTGIAAGELRPLRDPTNLEEQLAQLP